MTSYSEDDISDLSLLSKHADSEGVAWVDIDGVEDLDTLNILTEIYDIPPSIISEASALMLRPKVEDLGQYLHIAVITMRDQGMMEEVITEHVHLILGRNYVISIQEGAEGDVFDGVRTKLRHNVGGIRKKSADYLVYALLEAVIDSYFIILEDLGEKVEDLQDEMLENPSAQLLKQVRDLKRIARFLRRSVWPLREVLSELEREDSPLINDSNNLFFRRAYEHTIQVMDIAESVRDVLSDMLDIYLSSVSNRLNQVMKTLTVITTIFMPLSFIAGLYGMNFPFMPELGWRFGYPVVLIVMALIVVSMVIFFRRKDWL